MCQDVASHALSYPVEVMKFYCKHCHNFWVMKITWERSSPVQLQTVVSKFLWLLHVMEHLFKFNFGFGVLFDSNSCSLVPVFKMRRDHKKNNSNSYAEKKQCWSKDKHYWQSRSPNFRYDRDRRDWNRSRSLSSEHAGISWFTNRLMCYYTGWRRGECKTKQMCDVSHLFTTLQDILITKCQMWTILNFHIVSLTVSHVLSQRQCNDSGNNSAK